MRSYLTITLAIKQSSLHEFNRLARIESGACIVAREYGAIFQTYIFKSAESPPPEYAANDTARIELLMK